jgi:hypothetical protein
MTSFLPKPEANNQDGILISFPTGKFSWKDLTPSQRDELKKLY